MTTLAALADVVQVRLSDSAAATWDQATIEAFCNQAIRAYSQKIPRRVSGSIECAEDDRKYDLPAGFRAMLSVEYPAGEDPPDYLRRLSHHHPGFWQTPEYYDVIEHRDTADVDELWISEEPVTGETISIIYLADHDFALAAGGTVTVPGRHEGLLALYACHLAWLERATYWAQHGGEMQAGPYKERFEQEKSYRALAAQALVDWEYEMQVAERQEAGGGWGVRWEMDVADRVY